MISRVLKFLKMPSLRCREGFVKKQSRPDGEGAALKKIKRFINRQERLKGLGK
jgi:hypothetical protein